MPYIAKQLSRINAGNNTTVVFDYNTTGLPTTPRATSVNCWNYITAPDEDDNEDGMRDVMAANYFVSTPSLFAPGDWIYVKAANGSIILEVSEVNVGVQQKFFPAAAAIPATVLTQPVLGQIVTETTIISSADLLGGLTYGLTSAPATGNKYLFLGASLTLDFGTVAYAAATTTLSVRYGAAGPVCSNTVANTFLAAAADSSSMMIPIAVAVTAEATMRGALTLVAVGQPVDGNGALTVDCTYVVVES
jgi:hypothetical protein